MSDSLANELATRQKTSGKAEVSRFQSCFIDALWILGQPAITHATLKLTHSRTQCMSARKVSTHSLNLILPHSRIILHARPRHVLEQKAFKEKRAQFSVQTRWRLLQSQTRLRDRTAGLSLASTHSRRMSTNKNKLQAHVHTNMTTVDLVLTSTFILTPTPTDTLPHLNRRFLPLPGAVGVGDVARRWCHQEGQACASQTVEGQHQKTVGDDWEGLMLFFSS